MAVQLQDRSLKIEVHNGSRWEEAGVWRFPLEGYGESKPAKMCEAKLFARDLAAKQGVVGALRVVPSTDAVNYRYLGDIGNMHLERISS